MASNRTTLDALFDAWTSTLDLEATHKPNVREFLDSCLLNRDVSNSVTLSTASEDIDFTGYDYILATTAAATDVVTISGINQGEVKWLKIDDSGSNGFTLSGVTGSPAERANLYGSSSFWLLWNKDGNVNVLDMTRALEAATNSESKSGSSTVKYVNPAGLKYTIRNGHKVLANAESYSVADGVGSIEIPSGVSGGTITLPDVATFVNDEITIYSTGGSGVTVTGGGSPMVGAFTANYYLKAKSNGTLWYRLIYQSGVTA